VLVGLAAALPAVHTATAEASWPGRDGKIAFVSARGSDPNACCQTDLYTMGADGSGVTPLTSDLADDRAPAWSPDGRRLAFQSDRGGPAGVYDIWVVNADGTGLARVTDHPGSDEAPAWSADGSRVFFQSDRSGNFDIYSQRLDGADLRQLTRDPAADLGPAASALGTRIAWSRGGLWSANPDGTKALRRTTDPTDAAPDYDPTAQRVAFQSARGATGDMPANDIFTMKFDGTGIKRIAAHPADDFQPAYAPSGAEIVFTSTRDDVSGDIYAVRTDGSGLRRLTASPESDFDAAWQPLPR
jgi:TolB protein